MHVKGPKRDYDFGDLTCDAVGGWGAVEFVKDDVARFRYLIGFSKLITLLLCSQAARG